jgi:hypothetical protein
VGERTAVKRWRRVREEKEGNVQKKERDNAKEAARAFKSVLNFLIIGADFCRVQRCSNDPRTGAF